jgi:hypothetical protein
MSILDRFFGKKNKPAPEPMRGSLSEEQRTAEHHQQRETRERMEAEVAGAKERRDAGTASASSKSDE